MSLTMRASTLIVSVSFGLRRIGDVVDQKLVRDGRNIRVVSKDPLFGGLDHSAVAVHHIFDQRVADHLDLALCITRRDDDR